MYLRDHLGENLQNASLNKVHGSINAALKKKQKNVALVFISVTLTECVKVKHISNYITFRQRNMSQM